MRAPEPKTIVAYWLTPAEPARSFFASTIAELAARFDAPSFEPHVTIYAGEKGDDNPAEVLSHALDWLQAVPAFGPRHPILR